MKQETLGHFIQNNHDGIKRLNRRVRFFMDPFSVAEVPPATLEFSASVTPVYIDEIGREWHVLRHEGRKQFTVANLLIDSGIPVAPIIRRLSDDTSRYRYFAYRFPNEILSRIQPQLRRDDKTEDMWASDFILRSVFLDTDRALLSGSENNVETFGYWYYFYDFDAADLVSSGLKTSSLTDRFEVYKKYYDRPQVLLSRFLEKLLNLKAHLQQSHIPSLIQETMRESSGKTLSGEESEHIQKVLLNRLRYAQEWCEQQEI